MDEFIKAYIKAYIKAARGLASEFDSYVGAGTQAEEDDVPLEIETLKLMNEIEAFNRNNLIDQALASKDEELFMKLSAKEKVEC